MQLYEIWKINVNWGPEETLGNDGRRWLNLGDSARRCEMLGDTERRVRDAERLWDYNLL